MVKKFFVIFFSLPVLLFGGVKEDILDQVGFAFEKEQFDKCAELVKSWGELYPEDKIHAEACYSLFVLAQGNFQEFIELYSPIMRELSFLSDSSLLEAYARIVETVLSSKREELRNLMGAYSCSFGQFECRRGWKIKCVLGALCYTAGLFIFPFNPPVGGALMTSAGGLMLDGTLSALDEQDERKEKLADERPRNRACLLH